MPNPFYARDALRPDSPAPAGFRWASLWVLHFQGPREQVLSFVMDEDATEQEVEDALRETPYQNMPENVTRQWVLLRR
jgi:hypothetical protein